MQKEQQLTIRLDPLTDPTKTNTVKNLSLYDSTRIVK